MIFEIIKAKKDDGDKAHFELIQWTEEELFKMFEEMTTNWDNEEFWESVMMGYAGVVTDEPEDDAVDYEFKMQEGYCRRDGEWSSEMKEDADEEECEAICDTTQECTAYELSEGCSIYHNYQDLQGDGTDGMECWLKTIRDEGLPAKDNARGKVSNEENKKKSKNKHQKNQGMKFRKFKNTEGDCSIDETKNQWGPNQCRSDADCAGQRTCSAKQWCQGHTMCPGDKRDKET